MERFEKLLEVVFIILSTVFFSFLLILPPLLELNLIIQIIVYKDCGITINRNNNINIIYLKT